jgi:hypothetical protein
MRTLRLPDMVKRVSSLVENQSVNTFKKGNQITISTDLWDFTFTKIDDVGYYLYEDTIVTNQRKDEENQEIKEKLLKEVIRKFGITTTL